jgi:5-methylcytosine-specific restriction endonuclease McrA
MSAVKSIEKDELKDNSDMEFIVEKIHSKKCKDGKNVYLVEWANYPKKKDYTWEPVENLKECSIFQEYIENCQSKKEKRKREREDNGIIVKDIFKKNKREPLSKDERFDIIRLQNYKCNLCLNALGSSSFEIDHIIPLEQGGTYDLANLQGLCDSCHIFKTTVLDRGVIARLLQAKLQCKNPSSITRIEILEECQMIYANRNRHRVPFHDDEMLNFCISTVDIFKEMCKRKIKDMVGNTMNTSNTSNISNTSKINIKISKINVDEKTNEPPSPPALDDTRSSKYLNDLLTIIKKMIDLKCKSNVIKMKNFSLDIKFIEEIKDCDDNEIYDNLNMFFKEIYEKKLSNLEKQIGNIIFTYTKN